MRTSILRLSSGLAALACLALLAAAPPAGLPFDDFEVTVLATGLSSPKGLDLAQHRAGAGPMGKDVYVAEAGTNSILRVDIEGAGVEYFADSLGSFPVGMACYGGPFAQYMYVGNAMGGGIVRIDVDGNPTPFALTAFDVAGMDFGKGAFGNMLYVGEWMAGNIWRVDTQGNAELFATIPGCQTRYACFSHGGAFGKYLYTTDFLSGDVYRIAPDGTYELFASVGSPALEGLAFSPGGAFGSYLYTGDLTTGEIFRIDADGVVELWADGFPGAADIRFAPGGKGGFTMYMVDGVSSVYAIGLEPKA